MMSLDVLTEKEAADLYKISKRTLSNLRKDNKIPYKKVGSYSIINFFSTEPSSYISMIGVLG